MCDSRIFKAAVKLSPERRAAYLDQACGTDQALRREVEWLLRANEEAAGFLQSHPDRPLVTVDEPRITEGPSTMIGPYKLLQQIGEGGMGVVYMAEQEQPVRRKVALKIIKSGLDSAQVIARFEAERQALALMDHPNIAKVLDAGTIPGEPGCVSAGRPYFVMELVKGVPITRFCDEHQLTPRQRLELFIPVCQAVQHAHQKGIIHRDLKPSNVLVALYDDRPVPKVIDFGVAKATSQKLTERTLFTAFGSFIGTLEYMSPEQAKLNALDIDTRSDIYALGVLLYELLTGNTPLEHERLKQTALDELLRIIREDEPPSPSTRLSYSGERLVTISAQRGIEPAKLGQVLRGELDWIVMKALEKERTRRYETANGLARDIQHYLADEPVEACPPSAGYKLRKFARKHKAGLATAAGFAALLVLGTAVSAWQAVRATQAEVIALANEQQANANAVQAKQKEQEANQQRNEAEKQRDEVRALNEQLRATQAHLRGTLYAAHMNLAQQAWEAGNPERVRELLEQHRPKPGETDLRGFEWDYLYRLCHAELFTLKVGGFGGRFAVTYPWNNSVAFSPDGKRLVGSGQEGPKVWDAQTGQELLTLKGGGSNVIFSPDGKRLAGAAFHSVKVWDAQTGQELLTLKGGGSNVAYSPDGKRLASTAEAGLKVWDAQTGQELLTLKGHKGSINCVAFSPDGKRLALASKTWDNTKHAYVAREVKVWDVQTGQELLSFKGGGGSLSFSPDGKRIASAEKVWDAQTGKELLTINGGGYIMAFSPDGKRLAGADHKAVKVWDAQTGQELLTFRGHAAAVLSVAYSPDGRRLASTGLEGTVKVWDAQTDPKPLTLQGTAGSSAASVAFTPDGKRLASAGWARPGSGPGALKVWDAQTGRELLSLKGQTANVTTAAYSPDGKRLAGADDKVVKVWDAQTGQELFSLEGHTGTVYSVAFSPDGRRLASASADNTVKVWDAQTGQVRLTLKGYNNYVTSVTFSPDGKRLASGGGQTTIPGQSPVTVKVWDAQTGQELLALEAPFEARVAFSPDGKRLASAEGDDKPGEIKVWDAQTGQVILTLKGHARGVNGVAFSPDGKRLASAGVDKTVKVWDAQTGQELLSFEGSGRSVAFSPDGHRLASGSSEGTVTIWDATPLPEKAKP